VKFTEEYEHNEFKTEVRTGIVCAKNFNDAMYKITDYYGDENIEDVRIEFIEDIDIVEFDELRTYFEKKIETIEDPVIEKDGAI
jgi:uncharacterized protein with FMN-binding domain